MILLNFPEFSFRIRNGLKGEEIFDIIRKKFVALTDEEWVRQNCIAYLINQKSYPASLISVEKALKVNGLNKRTDVVIFTKDMLPRLIIECKAPHIPITNEVFSQIARYNMTLKVKFLLVTNGLLHYCCWIDFENEKFSFLENIPDYKELF
jgi:hypothetical protein